MHRSTRRNWEDLARENALGAILTGDRGTLRTWSLDEFFATGQTDVAAFFDRIGELAPLAPRHRALDFGCGVGRITRALSELVSEVVGVDAARAMIRQARRLNADRAGCTFVLNRQPDLRPFSSASFDLVYSRLVLQHIVPRIARSYISELVRVLAPGGVLMFQLPEPIDVDDEEAFCSAPVTGSAIKRALPRLIVRPYRWLKFRVVGGSPRGMRMFGIARNDVTAIVSAAGGRILAVDDDRSHGTGHQGYAYWVTK